MSIIHHAIILAAGLGTRLRSVAADVPKGLLTIGGEPIISRSLRLLRHEGIETVTIVTGHLAEQYRRFAADQPDIELLVNEHYATTGSMASLAVALRHREEDVLVLESDLVYEGRALTALLDSEPVDATLLSGPTGAGDEVWVDAPNGRVKSMSKNASDLAGVSGEFVGITKLTRAGAAAMLAAFDEFVAAHVHGRMNYETDALVAVAERHAIAAVIVDDLCWGEIDDDRQFARVVKSVWPALRD